MMGTDPVCGKEVDRDEAEPALLSAMHQGVSYFFCSADCKKRFEAQPESFVGSAASQLPPEEEIEGEVDRAWE